MDNIHLKPLQYKGKSRSIVRLYGSRGQQLMSLTTSRVSDDRRYLGTFEYIRDVL